MNSDNGPAPTRPLSLLICINRRFRGDQPSCAQRGSEAIADAIEAGIAERLINSKIERIKCLGQCTKGPAVRFAPGGRFNLETSIDDVPALLDELEKHCGTSSDTAAPPVHLLGS